MADIVFPATTAPGQAPGEGAGRLVNCFSEKLDGGARGRSAIKRAPGLVRIATASQVGCRGLHYHNGTLYVALAERLVKITRSGLVYTVTDLGSLPGLLRVTFARNNSAPIPDILCVTEDDVFVVTDSSAPASLSDGDLPQSLTVDFLDGYFIFAIRDGRYFVSGINDTTINALDFGKAESRSGGLYTAIAYGEQLLLCGPSSIEVWQNAGNATGTPFSRAAVIPKGIASTFAIGGNTDGFSAIVFVGDDNGVYILNGSYTPTKISTPDFDSLIEAVADKTTIDVTVGATSGHMWATVTGPTFSWTYEVGAGGWHERKSFNEDRWRGICSVKAFDGKWAIGDRDTGDIWLLDGDVKAEGTDPLVMTIQSLPTNDFPNRTTVPRADFDVIVGQALVTGVEPVETDPVCLISWSDDGGATFGNPLIRSLGQTAKHKTPVTINRTGTTSRYGRVWKIEVSDPVYCAWIGGTMDAEARSR